MRNFTTQELLHGKDVPATEARVLRAGELTVLLEGTDLRYVRLGDIELVRRLFAVIRDPNWVTPDAVVSDFTLDEKPDSFTVRFTQHVQFGAIDIKWSGLIEGRSDSTICYSIDADVLSDFRYCRFGFNLLHPTTEMIGRPYRAQTPDGPVNGLIPDFIAPQAIRDGIMRSPLPSLKGLSIDLRSAAGDEATVHFDFEGDLFETEDHRNWTDASYKTYSHPLYLPWPMDIKAGEKLSQRITVSVPSLSVGTQTHPSSRGLARYGQPITINVGVATGKRIPAIGLGMATHGQPLTEWETELLRSLGLNHLRVDLQLKNDDYMNELARAAAAAKSLGAFLELALFLSDNGVDELADLATTLLEIDDAKAVRFLVFHEAEECTSGQWLAAAREALSAVAPGVPILGGSNTYYCQFSRSRSDITNFDGIVYSINPQIHAFDDTSLIETLYAQGETVEDARKIGGTKSIHVSPVTFRPRFNAVATQELTIVQEVLPWQVDHRQMSLFGAAWTLGSIKFLAEAAAASVTYFETTGWRGVIEAEQPTATHPDFKSAPGVAFPLYHVFAELAEWPKAEIVACTTSDPLAVVGLALTQDGRTKIILANITQEDQPVELSPLARAATLKRLNAGNVLAAMTDPATFRATPATPADASSGKLALTLKPFELVVVEA